MITAPRLEVDLEKIHHNARTLVELLAGRGIAVTGVTKATLGSPEIAAALLRAGVSALGDTHVETVEAMRQAGEPVSTASMTLLRSPMISQVDRVVASADVSFNTDLGVIGALSCAAQEAGRMHGIVLMVELGDLREGILPGDLEDVVRKTLRLPNLVFRGIGTNLACRSGVSPDAKNMSELSGLARSVEARFGLGVAVVSGGNSANLDWARSGADVGRINDLRLGESILLGRETLRRQPIDGLYTDAVTLVAEVIESKLKPSLPWGTIGQNAFGEPPPANDRGNIRQTILAIGRQDTDPSGLLPPPGIEVLGASSDHLIVTDAGGHYLAAGVEVRFQLNYSALLRSMTSPFVVQRMKSEGPTCLTCHPAVLVDPTARRPPRRAASLFARAGLQTGEQMKAIMNQSRQGVNRHGPIDALPFIPKMTRLRPSRQERAATAVVYCEGNFGSIDGKTANGLVRHSEKYDVLSVIDSEQAGSDTGMLLDGEPNGIPVCRDLAEVLDLADALPNYYIFGMAPASGMLSTYERGLVLEAIGLGMNVVNGLHEFLSDDLEFAAASAAANVEIQDVRKPRDKKDLRTFSGRVAEVTCPRIAVLGTDCAIGKRTTATILTRALNDRGLKTVLIGTGQTGLIQGARYGVALDAVPSQFCSGELESAILEAFEREYPDVIVIEGQGALSHPAYSTSSFILRGSCPDGVVLQHAPGRLHRCDFQQMPMPTPATEIQLIQTFADTRVIGLTINHENMSEAEVSAAMTLYECELNIPVTDVLTRPPDRLVEMVLGAFPELEEKVVVAVR